MSSNGSAIGFENGQVDLSNTFQLTLVSGVLTLDPRLVPTLDLIQPEHLSVPGLDAVWDTIRDCLRDSGHVPSRRLLREMLFRAHREPEERAFFGALLKKCRKKVRDVEITYLLRRARDFAAMQQILIASRDVIPLIERGDLAGVREMLGRAIMDGRQNGVGLGTKFVSTVEARVRARRKTPRAVVRTLIPELDRHLRNNGLRAGETGCFLANTGVGKTRALVWIARAAALQKKRVVYYTLQLTEEDIAEALDASIAGVLQMDVVAHGARVIEKVSGFGRIYGDCILIKAYQRNTAGPHTFDAHLRECEQMGWVPDVMCVDFMNYAIPSYASNVETREGRDLRIQAAMNEWIGLTQKRRMIGWTAFQGKREAKAKLVAVTEDIAESYAAAMECTLLISINRTPEEKKAERARLHIAKYTFGGDGFTPKIHTNYKKGSFYSARL